MSKTLSETSFDERSLPRPKTLDQRIAQIRKTSAGIQHIDMMLLGIRGDQIDAEFDAQTSTKEA